MYVHTSIILIVVVCVVAVDSHHRKCADESDALSQHIVDVKVCCLIVIGCQCQDTPRHRIHDINTWCLHDDISCEVCWQIHRLRYNSAEFCELCLGRKFTKKQQISSLLKYMTFSLAALYQILHIVAAIQQLSITWDFLTVHILKCYDLGNVCKSGQYSLTILVTKTTLYTIFAVQFFVDVIVLLTKM